MGMVIPASIPYQNPVIALPTNMMDVPTEGNKFIPMEVDWGSMGGPSKCVYVSLGQNATLDFRKLSAMWVDNSQNGSDVTFYFPSSSSTLVVPAVESVMVPVPANVTEFYVSCAAALAIDITRIDCFNFVPPPVVLPKTSFQNSAVVSAIAFAAGTTQLIPSTISGTLESINLRVGFNTASAFVEGVSFQDGTPTTIAGTTFAGPNPSYGNFDALENNNLNIRFKNGVSLTQAGSFPSSGQMVATLLYRVP